MVCLVVPLQRSGFAREQAGSLAREAAAGALAVAEAAQEFVELLAIAAALGDLRRAHVRALADHAGGVQHAVVVGVGGAVLAVGDPAGIGVEQRGVGVMTPASSRRPRSAASSSSPARSGRSPRGCGARRAWLVPTAFGLKVGRLTIASTSPVATSSTTAEPLLAPVLEHRIAQLAIGQVLDATVDAQRQVLARLAARTRSTFSTMRPRRSRITRFAPGVPRSQSSNASSRPSWPRSSMLVKPSTCAIASPCG
jgi:hypothetical protein